MYYILVMGGKTKCIIHFLLGPCNRVSPFVCVCMCVKMSWHICVITWDWMCQVISTSVKESRDKGQAIWWAETMLNSSGEKRGERMRNETESRGGTMDEPSLKRWQKISLNLNIEWFKITLSEADMDWKVWREKQNNKVMMWNELSKCKKKMKSMLTLTKVGRTVADRWSEEGRSRGASKKNVWWLIKVIWVTTLTNSVYWENDTGSDVQ